MKIYRCNIIVKEHVKRSTLDRTLLDELKESLCVSKKRLLFYVPEGLTQGYLLSMRSISCRSLKEFSEKSLIPRRFWAAKKFL